MDAWKIVYVAVNVTTWVIMVAINVIAQFGLCGLCGPCWIFSICTIKTPIETSDARPSTFAPIGVTYVIWPVIYAAEAAFIVYSSIIPNQWIYSLGFSVGVLNLAVTVWTLVWMVNGMYLSAMINLFILLNISYIYSVLEVTYFETSSIIPIELMKWVFFNMWVSMFSAWIVVSTFINFLKIPKFESADDESRLTLLCLLGLVVPTIWVLYFRNDIPFAVVILWSIVGIHLRNILDGRIWLASLASYTIILTFVFVRIIQWIVFVV